MPTFIELDIDAITDESIARAILSLVERIPHLEPIQYDINRRGSPRAWELDRAVVDLLTQRTQFFVVEGRGGEVLIATGKHGEPPTVAINAEIDDATSDEFAQKLPVRTIHR